MSLLLHLLHLLFPLQQNLEALTQCLLVWGVCPFRHTGDGLVPVLHAFLHTVAELLLCINTDAPIVHSVTGGPDCQLIQESGA